MNMRTYKTGYFAWEHEIKNKRPVIGKYFKASYSNTQEVILTTNNYENARNASQLICSSLSLFDACVAIPFESIPEIVPQQNDKENIPLIHLGLVKTQRSNIVKAVSLAAKVSYKRKLILALLKYQFACEIHSNDLNDLYPEYFKLSKNPSDHLRIANAIVVFYSILEELGLEIRANKDNPSKIDGKWNSKVKDELINRLVKSKINLNNKVNWHLRSTPTKIEKLNKPEIVGKSKWAESKIRDSQIEIIDAIAYASWLRSKIASHKLNKAFTSLSIYDVANINHLTRKILLDTTGCAEYSNVA